jgi:hypothetical protein
MEHLHVDLIVTAEAEVIKESQLPAQQHSEETD